MTYEQVASSIVSLSYRDKLRLAQLLIQLARKEEEEQNATGRSSTSTDGMIDDELIQYVADRLMKLKPTKKDAVLNSIGAMFQFRGGVPDVDKQRILDALVQQGYITLGANSRVRLNDRQHTAR